MGRRTLASSTTFSGEQQLHASRENLDSQDYQEIRERLTEMREIDLQIQNESDKLDTRVESFFQSCKKQKLEWKTENFEEIRKEYSKLFENADEKVQIANQLYDLIEKYIKKLDQELQKFKLELEADHAGITSKLEQVVSSKEEDGGGGTGGINATGSSNALTSLGLNFGSDHSDFTLCPSSTNDLMMMMLMNNNNNNSSTNGDMLTAGASSSSTMMASGSHKRKHSSISDKNSTMNSAVNLLNSLASRGGADDEDSSSSWASSSHPGLFVGMPPNKKMSIFGSNKKGGGTPSASSSAIRQQQADSSLLNLLQSGSGSSSMHGNNRRPSVASNRPTAPVKHRRDRVKNRGRLNDYDFDDESSNLPDDYYQSDETGDEGASESGAGGGDLARNFDDDLMTSDEDNLDDDFDQLGSTKFKLNKQNSGGVQNRRNNKEYAGSGDESSEKYCICKDVSYGEMIACDNQRCGTQWFHFLCVGLNAAPKGKWFCPSCVEIKKKRRERHLNVILQHNAHLPGPSSASSMVGGGLSNTDQQSVTNNVNMFISPTSF